MSVVDHIVAFPVAELGAFLHDFWPFADIHPVGDAAILSRRAAALVEADAVGAPKMVPEILLSSLKTVNELVDALLIEVRLLELFEPSRDEIRRPTLLEESDNPFLQFRPVVHIPLFPAVLLPFIGLSLGGVGQALVELPVYVPFQLPADDR